MPLKDFKTIDSKHGIKLLEETLSDGSKVYSVELPNVTLDAMSEKDAISIYDKLVEAFEQASSITLGD